MRWDEQRVENDMRLPGVGDGTVVRTFDAPEAMGINFHEVRARSALNHVPGESFGFSWTINPYRGCTHACVFCAEGSTPILLADGRSKPIADLRVGDAIYGTVKRGSHRRYAPTEVLAHWRTRKPAYRIALEDGTELVTSGDHRFLTDGGWKYVTGAEAGPLRRAFLTPDDKLIGMGSLGAPGEENEEYERGYLCGMIRGDGSIGSYPYERPGRDVDTVHRFRLASADFEALDRSRDYLAFAGVRTAVGDFHSGNDRHRPLRAIGNRSRDGVDRIHALIEWPRDPSTDWYRGFLGGIFDAEGSCNGSLRIANVDMAMIDPTVNGLRRLGFSSVVEGPNKIGLRSVRLLGGLREQQRLLNQIDPAIGRKRSIAGIAIGSAAKLGVVEIEPLGKEIEMFDISTGTEDFIADGVVSHNCFARRTHSYLDLDAGRDFEREIVVKVNVPELVRAELARPSWRRELVALGTNTDPYQWCESRYRMLPEILEALLAAETPVSVLTKSPLVMRDIELFERFRDAGLRVSVNLSVPTLDEKAWRLTEPHTPSPSARLDAVAELRRRGIESGILIAPLMPGINDTPEQVEPIVARAKEADATFLGGVALHLRGEVKDVFFGWLRAKRPDLVPQYERLYANRAYMRPEDRQKATRALRGWGRQRMRTTSTKTSRPFATPATEPNQTSLF
ncbi:MAG TPA: radical SAM protein [Solirubrobacterales bacterium]|nr:radical SAM protein [Solirubrobacterales bacterium]